jgi:hypothetical protein
VTKLGVGYIHDWPLAANLYLGLGGLVSLYALPSVVDSAYGGPRSYMAFVRLKLD